MNLQTRREGFQKPENFADVLYGWLLRRMTRELGKNTSLRNCDLLAFLTFEYVSTNINISRFSSCPYSLCNHISYLATISDLCYSNVAERFHRTFPRPHFLICFITGHDARLTESNAQKNPTKDTQPVQKWNQAIWQEFK